MFATGNLAANEYFISLECVCISLEKETDIDFGSLYGCRHGSAGGPASFATYIKIKQGQKLFLPFVCISHNLKKHVADIHKCRIVSELCFKLFLGVQDVLNGLCNFVLIYVHVFACTEAIFL